MKVFVVEDSPTIILMLERILSSYGYVPFCYSSSTFSNNVIKDHSFDFFILDTNLANTNSINLCKKIRKEIPNSYIMGITHKGLWTDRIEFLNTGADDCISYPFPPEEMLARMQAILRRPKQINQQTLQYGKFKIDPFKKQAYYDRRLLKLSQKEYGLLEYFIRNNERSIPRVELLDHIWDYRKNPTSNTVDVHVTKLRKKIYRMKDKKYDTSNNFNSEIHTVYGVGYRMADNFEDKTNLSS